MVVEIVDEASAQAWLEKQDHQTQVWFAARCALRAAPPLAILSLEIFDRIALASFRAMLTSAAVAACPAGQMRSFRSAALSSAAVSYSLAISIGDTAPIASSIADASSSAADAAAVADRSASSAAAAAIAAARSARSAAYFAYNIDTKHILSWPPLWPGNRRPAEFSEYWEDLKNRFIAEPEKWQFWQEWYEAILNGDPLPWDLSFRIATELSNEDWESGSAHVAERIKEVRAEWEAAQRTESVPELESKKLHQHVKSLLQNPDMTALAAEGAADVLERAIRDFLDAGIANRLPEELEHLEGLPPIFRRIASLVKAEGKAATKERQLTEEIDRLNAKVAALEADLKQARAKSVSGLFTKSAIVAAGTAFGAGGIATLGMATQHLFGLGLHDGVLENLRGWMDMLEHAEPASDGVRPALPSALDV